MFSNFKEINWNKRIESRDNYTYMMIAHENNYSSIVNFLIDVGADIYITNNDNQNIFDLLPLTINPLSKKSYKKKFRYKRTCINYMNVENFYISKTFIT